MKKLVSMKTALLVGAGVGAITWSDLALAQASTTQGGIEEVVVTAEKRSERLQDVPVPVSVVTAENLVDSNELRIQDYYTKIPGLNMITDEYGQPQITIRGLSSADFITPTVGVTIDDVPFGASSNLADGEEIPDLDPSDLSNIEVLRGPQGTLYGAGAMGGLVKFETVNPSTDSFFGNVQAGISTVENGAEPGYSARGFVNMPVSDDFAVHVSAFGRQDPGYIDDVLTGRKGVNEGHAVGGFAAGLWTPSSNFSLKVTALVQDSSASGTAFTKPGLGEFQQSTEPFGNGEYNKDIEAFGATMNLKLGDVTMTSVTGYGINTFSLSTDASFLYGPTFSYYYGLGGAPLFTEFHTRKITQELRFTGTLFDHLDWLVGGFYNNENSHENQYLYVENPDTGAVALEFLHDYEPVLLKEYAAFANLTYHFTDQFDIQLGARETEIDQSYTENFYGPYDQIFLGQMGQYFLYPQENVTEHSFTYMATPQLKVSPDLMIYARAATGFNPGGPNVNAASFGLPPSYKQSASFNYEIGVKGQSSDHMFSFDASAYFIEWRDFQLTFYNSKDGESYIANGGPAKSEGFELSGEARPMDGLTIDAWADYDNAVLEVPLPSGSTGYGLPGARLPYTTKLSGHISAEQDFPIAAGWTGYVAGEASFVGSKYGDFTGSPIRQFYPAYGLVNLRLGARADTLSLNFYVNNVGSTHAATNGGLGTFSPYYGFVYTTPRVIGFSVSKAF